MAPTPHARSAEAVLSRRASGALSLQDDFDCTRVGSVEIALWSNPVQGTGGIAVLHPASSGATHFALPATIIAPLLAAVFQPSPALDD